MIAMTASSSQNNMCFDVSQFTIGKCQFTWIIVNYSVTYQMDCVKSELFTRNINSKILTFVKKSSFNVFIGNDNRNE